MLALYICGFGLLLTGIAPANGLAKMQQDKLRLEHADRLQSYLEDGQIVRKLEGNVRFRQGETEMVCDRAYQYTRDQISIFSGHVFIREENRSLQADEVIYEERNKRYTAKGKVKLVNRETVLTAERAIYELETRTAYVDSNVHVINTKERMHLTAGHGEYYRNEEYMKATIDPVLVEVDSAGQEVTRILGELIESFDRGKRMKVSDSVRIFHQSTRAQCQFAEYFADSQKVVLSVDPVVWQGRERLVGDVVELHLNDRELKQVHVLGNAVAISQSDSLAENEQPNRLTGQKIYMYLEHEKLKRVVIEGTATSVFNIVENGEFKGLNKAEGDRITLYVNGNVVERARVESDPGKSTGKFLPPGFDAVVSESASGNKGSEGAAK